MLRFSRKSGLAGSQDGPLLIPAIANLSLVSLGLLTTVAGRKLTNASALVCDPKFRRALW